MILVDANLLLYAYHPRAPQHDKSRAWLQTVLSGSDLVRFAWLALWAFLRISTNHRAFEHPLSTSEAEAAISYWLAQPAAGILEPGEQHSVLSGANADWLRKRIRLGPFTLRKLTTELAARGIKTDVRAVWTFVHAEGMSFKKTIKPAEQDRPDVARKRIRWKAHQGRIDASRLVFIDETWIKTNMAPLRGWGPSGQRLVASAPFGHWHDLHCGAALRPD
jgi:hypothetical protein